MSQPTKSTRRGPALRADSQSWRQAWVDAGLGGYYFSLFLIKGAALLPIVGYHLVSICISRLKARKFNPGSPRG